MSALKQRVMRRVYATWMFRKAISPTALKIYVLLVAIWQVVATVSIRNVMHNATNVSDLFGGVNFFKSAFLNTQAIVQVSLFAALICGVWFMRDIIKARAINQGYR